jgi:hypothetical protein
MPVAEIMVTLSPVEFIINQGKRHGALLSAAVVRIQK